MGHRNDEAPRCVYYLFRAGALPRVPFARFTDRADAVSVARDLERHGWRVAVLSRREGPDGPEPERWRQVYRSPAPRRQRNA